MSFTDRRFHMIGIGGAGVSALATVAYAWGAEVTGCDRARNPYLDRLERFGIPGQRPAAPASRGAVGRDGAVAAVDLRGRRARQDDDVRDDRLCRGAAGA